MQVIGEAADGTTIELRVGEAAELRLGENASTGFRWQVRQDGAPSCRIAGEAREPPAAQVPGQGGAHVWRIEGVQPGLCSLALDYGRPWEPGTARRFSLHVRLAP